MSYSEPTNALVLENSLPMSDTEGKAQSKYFEFTVSTHATTDESDNEGITIPYEINISDIAIDSGMTQLPKSKIKVNLVSVSGTTETEVLSPTLITELESSSLRDGSTKVYNTSDTHKNNNASITTKYRLRAWVDKDYLINNGDTNVYQYKFRVNVNSQVNVIGVEYPVEATLLSDAILDQGVVTSGDGLYKSTETNDGSPTYYYHGNTQDNYVSFANLIWRVIRINEDGTIKMILDDKLSSNANFNKNNGDQYIYMYYSESDVEGGIKKTVDEWYTTTLEEDYDSYIATTNFCEAAKVKKYSSYTSGNATLEVASNYTADFKCEKDGNNKQYVSEKAGLITVDEVVMAGIPLYTGSQIDNTNTYLQESYMWWTMSPAGFYDINGARAWRVAPSGAVKIVRVDYYAGSSSSVLPVISLNADTLVTGSGASGDKWVVQ